MAALSQQLHSPDLTTRLNSFRPSPVAIASSSTTWSKKCWRHQPPELQDFLLKTSILERLSGLLCDAIVGEMENGNSERFNKPQITNSQSVLEHLESANLFIVPLDNERLWYRYHRLFSDLLRKRLCKRLQTSYPRCTAAASNWYEQQGFIDAAIHHALAAKSFERATILIEENVEATLMRSEIRTFLNWMEQLPDEYVRTRPKLCFFQAFALIMSGHSLEVVEQHLRGIAFVQDAAQSTSIMTSRMAVFRAYLMLFQANLPRSAELCHQALDICLKVISSCAASPPGF